MNRKFLYVIVAIVIILVIFGGYLALKNNSSSTSQNSPTPSQPTTTQGQPTTPPPAQAANMVVINNFAFSPSAIKIKKGETVIWKNEDSVAHTIKSDTFESKALANGDTYQYTFNTTGTFNYICSIHPSMTGTVTVE